MKNRKSFTSTIAFWLAALMLLTQLAGVIPMEVSAASSSEIRAQIDALESMAEETLGSAAETIDFINKVDIESLNASIEKLNEILTSLSGFLSLFGGNRR